MRDLLMQELNDDNFLKTDIECEESQHSNPPPPVKSDDSVDPVLLHVAKDVSQQSYEIEKKKRAEQERQMEEEAIRRSLIDQQRQQKVDEERSKMEQEQARHALMVSMQQQQVAGKTLQRHDSGFTRDMEEAIALSLLETSQEPFSIYQGAQRPRNVPPPIPIGDTKCTPTQSRSAAGTPKAIEGQASTPRGQGNLKLNGSVERSSSVDEISDPAVLAFMEKRKHRLQQQKDEVLAKQVMVEAARLNVHPQHIVNELNPITSQKGTPKGASSLKSMSCDAYSGRENTIMIGKAYSQDPSSLEPTISHNIDYFRNDRSQSFDIPEQRELRPLSPTRYNPAVSRSIEGKTMGSVADDASHILHPDNAAAVRCIDTLVQIARLRIQSLPQYESVGHDAAAMQLASLWMSQVSLLVLSGKSLPLTIEELRSASLSSSSFDRSLPISSKNEFAARVPVEHLPLNNVPRSLSTDNHHRTQPKTEGQWSCNVCTLINSVRNQVCDACASPRI